MPYVNIKVTKEQDPITSEQKQRLIQGVTDLLKEVLGRGPKTTVVVIDEIDMDNYGIGGEAVAVRRQRGE